MECKINRLLNIKRSEYVLCYCQWYTPSTRSNIFLMRLSCNSSALLKRCAAVLARYFLITFVSKAARNRPIVYLLQMQSVMNFVWCDEATGMRRKFNQPTHALPLLDTEMKAAAQIPPSETRRHFVASELYGTGRLYRVKTWYLPARLMYTASGAKSGR